MDNFELPENPSYGFVGIGVMGYGMALNLCAKLQRSTQFVLCEINEARKDQFVKECGRPVELAKSPREVVAKAVRILAST
jgi:3-hydroxyisobutyrate/3-hydroxypropionate dehydrogenase